MIKKYAIAFGIFGLFYLLMRNIENRVDAVKKLGNIGGTPTAS